MSEKLDILDYGRVFDEIVTFISEYAKNIKSDIKFVIGISGGIDSALCATLCTYATSKSAVYGIYLPSSTNSEESEKLSYDLAKSLGFHLDVVDVGAIKEAFVENFEASTHSHLGDIAQGNISARLRMVTLMAATNEFGGVMVNTGNMTEKFLGYYTLYGDGAGAIAPIASLLKTDVWNLSRYINENVATTGEGEIIDSAIIDRKPSAELVPGQCDEDDFGASYEQIDKCIIDTFNGSFDSAKIEPSSLEENLFNRYISNKFKKLSNIVYPSIRVEQETFMQNN